MTDDILHRGTRDMAVKALERANQAHERLDRHIGWMRSVNEGIDDVRMDIGVLRNEVTSLKVKVALGVFVGSLAGSSAVGLIVKFVG